MAEAKHEEFVSYLKAEGEPHPDMIAEYAEGKLLSFMQSECDPELKSIYSFKETDYYIQVLDSIKEGSTSDNGDKQLANSLDLYIRFLRNEHHAPATEPDDQSFDPENLTEGQRQHITSEKVKTKRNQKIKRECAEYYGYVCQICGFNFVKAYGELGKNFIEVHHVLPISETEGEHSVNIKTDVIPLCSNCHSMIHHYKGRVLEPDELRQIYKGIKWEITGHKWEKPQNKD